MKKLLILSLVLMSSLLAYSSSFAAYSSCNINTPILTFCHCFINNCESQGFGGRCTYAYLKATFDELGIENTCRMHGDGTNLQECEAGIKYFENACQGIIS